MFAARGNVRVLDRARRVGRHVSVLAVCAVGIGVGLATPAQADKIERHEGRGEPGLGADPERRRAPRGDDRALQRRQVPPPADDGPDPRERGASRDRAREPQERRTTRSTSRSSAPTRTRSPDPLQAALEARNFGQVLEQFALLDRAQSYNASILTDIRDYRKDVDSSQRVLNRERNARRDTVAELQSLKGQIQSSDRGRQAALQRPARQGAAADRGAPPGRDRGLAPRRRAARRLQAAPTTQAVAVNDIGGVASATPERSRACPSRSRRPRRLGEAAVNFALGQLGTPYSWGGAAPGGFDCSGLVSWAYAPGRPRRTAALHGRALELGHAHLLAERPRAGRPRLLPRPRPRGHVHRRRQLRARAAHRRRREDLESRQLQRLRRRCAHQRLAGPFSQTAPSSTARMPESSATGASGRRVAVPMP